MHKRRCNDFTSNRWGHNGYGARPIKSRITYMAHAKGYVMARRPGCMPFVISEKLWLSFELYDKTRHT